MFEVIELSGLKTTTTKNNCNHVYVVDVSGSMSRSLPQLRQNLKNIVSTVAKPGDTFSVIWFSGKGQCGVVFENMLVGDASTLSAINKAIDQYLVPQGLTCFTDPIKLSLLLNLNKANVNSFIFMSDGYDNTSTLSDIMHLVEQLPGFYDAITFLEYGYYADREVLAKMARLTGGIHIFAEGFEKYSEAFEQTILDSPETSRITVDVNKKAKHGIYIYNSRIYIVDVIAGMVSIPSDVDKVYSIVPSDVVSKQLSEDHIYLILYYAAKVGNDKLIWDCLYKLGDIRLVRLYENAFTKQELSDFEMHVDVAVRNKDLRYLDGKDLDIAPDRSKKTILDLLSTLSLYGAALDTESSFWKYNRTGRTSEANSQDDEDQPVFMESRIVNLDSLRGLVFNSERPNVSLGVTRTGKVKLPKNEFGLDYVDSKIHRNYTIIRDGIKNILQIPVVIDEDHLKHFQDYDYIIVENAGGKTALVFDITNTPVVNRENADNLTLDDIVETEAYLTTCKAALKVLGYYIKELDHNRAIEGLSKLYGEEAAKWLSSIGVRDYGFSPVGTKVTEATDEYPALVLSTKIKSLSSLPSIPNVLKKLESGKKLTLSESLINRFIGLYKDFDIHELESEYQDLNTTKREKEQHKANLVYTCILGRKWFSESDSITVPIKLGPDLESTITVEKIRKLIKI